MTGGLSHTLHEGSGQMTGLMVETPHPLGSASTELRSRVEAPGDGSGDAAGTTYFYFYSLLHRVYGSRIHQPSISVKSRSPSSLSSDVNVIMKTLVLAGCGLIDFGGKLKLSG